MGASLPGSLRQCWPASHMVDAGTLRRQKHALSKAVSVCAYTYPWEIKEEWRPSLAVSERKQAAKPEEEKMRVRESATAITVSDVGRRGRRAAGGLGVRLPGETRDVHRIRHAHWHTHGWACTADRYGVRKAEKTEGRHSDCFTAIRIPACKCSRTCPPPSAAAISCVVDGSQYEVPSIMSPM